MSKYSHFEMCEKIFGNKYKFDKRINDYVPYTRTDMWDKLVEQQEENKIIKKALELACKSLTYYYNLENIEYGIDGKYNKLEIYNNLIEQAKENIYGKINN